MNIGNISVTCRWFGYRVKMLSLTPIFDNLHWDRYALMHLRCNSLVTNYCV